MHQIPGVYFCPIHFSLLLDSTVLIHQKNKHAFIAADKLTCKITPHVIQFDESTVEELCELALDIKWLMDNYDSIRNSDGLESGFQEIYLDMLKNKGLATSKGHVYQHELISDSKNYYGESFLQITNSDVT